MTDRNDVAGAASARRGCNGLAADNSPAQRLSHTYAHRMDGERPLMTRDGAERLVRKHLPAQVGACEEISELAWTLLGADPWRGRPVGDGMVDKLVASESARGLKTYRAAVDAALGGFGPQASMLARSLFEGMAMAHWIRENPETAVERFEQHLRHNRGIWSKRLFSRRWIEEPLDQIPDEDEQKRLDRIFGPWGDKLWCGLSLHQLVDAIEPSWPDDERVALRDFSVVVNPFNNETLHTTAMSLAGPVLEDTETIIRLDAGPSLALVEESLLGSLWSYTHLLKVAADHFAIDAQDQITDVFGRGRAAFVRIDPQARQQTGRNDPCPCGSGQKFKRCHGR